MPTREQRWTNLKGLQFNLTTNQKHVRNYVFGQAKKMVMKQTNGLYPAPLQIMEVRAVQLANIVVQLCSMWFECCT